MRSKQSRDEQIEEAMRQLFQTISTLEEDYPSGELAGPAHRPTVDANFGSIILAKMKDLEKSLHAIFDTVLILGGIKFNDGIAREELKLTYQEFKQNLPGEIDGLVKLLRDVHAWQGLAADLEESNETEYKKLLAAFEVAFLGLRKLWTSNLQYGSSHYLRALGSAVAAAGRARGFSSGDQFKDDVFPDLRNFMRILDDRDVDRGEPYVNWVSNTEDAEAAEKTPSDVKLEMEAEANADSEAMDIAD